MTAVLAQMTITFAGHALPSPAGFRTALLIAAAAAAGAALIAMAIPTAPRPAETELDGALSEAAERLVSERGDLVAVELADQRP
jgi:hypothetical protein